MKVISPKQIASSSHELSDSDYSGLKMDAASAAKALIVLVDGYTRPYSMFRELATNGVEALAMVGGLDPENPRGRVIVDLPRYRLSDDYHDGDNNVLSVTDHGPGMSEEFLLDVALSVLSSTKDEDDDAAGGFGLGIYSPLHLVNSYFVISARDGALTKVEVMMTERGPARPVIARGCWDSKTIRTQRGEFPMPEGWEGWDGSNFTRVEVPMTADVAPNFLSSLEEYLPMVDPNQVSVITPGWEDKVGTRLSGKFFGGNVEVVSADAPNNSESRIWAVVRGVAYPLPGNMIPSVYYNPEIEEFDTHWTDYAESGRLNIYLEPEDVIIKSNREALDDTAHLRSVIAESIKRAVKDYAEQAKAAWESEVEGQDAVTDKIAASIRYEREWGINLYRYGHQQDKAWDFPDTWGRGWSRSALRPRIDYHAIPRVNYERRSHNGYDHVLSDALEGNGPLRILAVSGVEYDHQMPMMVEYGDGTLALQDVQNSDAADLYDRYQEYNLVLHAEQADKPIFALDDGNATIRFGLADMADDAYVVTETTADQVAEDTRTVKRETNRQAYRRRNPDAGTGKPTERRARSKTRYMVLLPGDSVKPRNLTLDELLEDEAAGQVKTWYYVESGKTKHQGNIYGGHQVERFQAYRDAFAKSDFGIVWLGGKVMDRFSRRFPDAKHEVAGIDNGMFAESRYRDGNPDLDRGIVLADVLRKRIVETGEYTEDALNLIEHSAEQVNTGMGALRWAEENGADLLDPDAAEALRGASRIIREDDDSEYLDHRYESDAARLMVLTLRSRHRLWIDSDTPPKALYAMWEVMSEETNEETGKPFGKVTLADLIERL